MCIKQDERFFYVFFYEMSSSNGKFINCRLETDNRNRIRLLPFISLFFFLTRRIEGKLLNFL